MRDFEHYSREEETNPCYGCGYYIMTEDDIKHLRNGGKLYTTINADEYAIEIVLESEEQNEDQ